MTNNVEPYETAHYEPSHLDLRCLQKSIVIIYGSERFSSYYPNIKHILKNVVEVYVTPVY